MKTLLGLIAIFAIFGCSGAVNCTARQDGIYEVACRSYATCANGVVTIVECENGKVFNNATAACDDSTNVAPPCGLMKDCSKADSKKYADISNNCYSYYTCAGHKFKGHNICPGGTVFNEELQTCDWKEHVKAPCGTLTV